nr:hypothetical protein [uncultured Roseococcus sp.]
MTPEQRRQTEELARENMARNAPFLAASDDMLADAPRQEARDRQAAIICQERGNMAAAQPAYGGRGLAGSINAGLQQGWAGSEVQAACLRAYQATGIMPGY